MFTVKRIVTAFCIVLFCFSLSGCAGLNLFTEKDENYPIADPRGWTYQGEMKDGMKEGKGTLSRNKRGKIRVNHSYERGEAERNPVDEIRCEFRNDVPVGKASILYRDGSIYKGDIGEDYLRNGFGTLYIRNKLGGLDDYITSTVDGKSAVRGWFVDSVLEMLCSPKKSELECTVQAIALGYARLDTKEIKSNDALFNINITSDGFKKGNERRSQEQDFIFKVNKTSQRIKIQSSISGKRKADLQYPLEVTVVYRLRYKMAMAALGMGKTGMQGQAALRTYVLQSPGAQKKDTIVFELDTAATGAVQAQLLDDPTLTVSVLKVQPLSGNK